ncbi:MAG: energy transducer TonB [Betaproteobacteria bacterium]|nr:energy transducer TonB [Betaproteobacteria bacterium]
MLDFSERDSSTNRRATGLVIAVVVHIAIGYALVSGLARKVVEVIKQPLETKIIEEVKPPPPKPPPPLPPAPKPAPAPVAPPPSYPASIDSKTCSNSDEFYPRQSRQLNETGTVILRFVVEVNGSLSSVDIEKSSGYRRLDQAARKLLETCASKAPTIFGKPERGSGYLAVVWELLERERCPPTLSLFERLACQLQGKSE